MRPTREDIVATCAVVAAVVMYVLWLAEAALPGMSGTRATGLAILALGFVASATAVVPGFARLIHGNKLYLGATSLLGLVALAAGVVMLWSTSSTALAVMMAMLVALWLAATIHHLATAEPARSASPHQRLRTGRL